MKMSRRASSYEGREYIGTMNTLRSQSWMMEHIATLSTLSQERNEGKTILLQYANEDKI